MDDFVQKLKLQRDGSAIQNITNPSEELQLIAVKQHGSAPSEEVQLAAVNELYVHLNTLRSHLKKYNLP